MPLQGVVGAGIQAGADLTVGVLNHIESRKMRKVAEGQLDLAKEQYAWEKDKYNTTLKNQGEAYNTLGDSFGKALQNESKSPTLSQGTDSMASFAQTPTQSTTQDSSLSNSPAPQEKKEQPLPTERM
nr:hypothetical protein [uncultured Helicobacter sp.]